MTNEQIGKRLADLRIDPTTNRTIFTQRELAKKLNISHVSIGQYESGERNLTVKALSAYHRFFDVSYEYLLGESNSKKTVNIKVQKELGLSDEAIAVLKVRSQWPYEDFLKVFNFLIGQEEVPEMIYGQPFDKDGEPYPYAQKEYEQWKNKDLVPILTSIYYYLTTVSIKNKQFHIAYTGELFEADKSNNLIKFASIKNFSENELLENILLLEIQTRLKELKDKWNQR